MHRPEPSGHVFGLSHWRLSNAGQRTMSAALSMCTFLKRLESHDRNSEAIKEITGAS
jgi:hypothetical protein